MLRLILFATRRPFLAQTSCPEHGPGRKCMNVLIIGKSDFVAKVLKLTCLFDVVGDDLAVEGFIYKAIFLGNVTSRQEKLCRLSLEITK